MKQCVPLIGRTLSGLLLVMSGIRKIGCFEGMQAH